jgi:hypothetical protein
MKFYEIYVAGKHGFSTFVKTEIDKHDEDEILNRAIAAKVIYDADAKDICYGAGYVEEREEKDSEIWNKI